MHENVGTLQFTGRPGLAWRRVAGDGPTVVWLGGFKSDMAGTKASMLAAWAGHTGRDFLRFDYSGHGESEGAFEDGTIGAWREDALSVIDELTEGPLVLVGSSMGGWIASLAALERPERVKALVLIAPAADFTDRLMWPQFPREVREVIETTGRWVRPSPYDAAGYPITLALIEDGRRWNLLDAPVAITCPVRILQGGRDPDVPWRHAFALHELLASEDKVFTLVNDADHSMSRPQDLTRIANAIDEVA